MQVTGPIGGGLRLADASFCAVSARCPCASMNPGKQRPPAQVREHRFRPSQRHYVIALARRSNQPIAHSNGLRDRIARVHRLDIAAEEDPVRGCAIHTRIMPCEIPHLRPEPLWIGGIRTLTCVIRVPHLRR